MQYMSNNKCEVQMDMIRRKIKRRCAAVIALLSTVMLSVGCVTKVEMTDKICDLQFTVLEKTELPEELKQKILKNRKKAFHLTYSDQGELYIVEGYGEKSQSGYSVKVTELYETAEAIYIHTELDGPSREEETKEVATYPYVAVKTKEIGKPVRFK